MQRKSLLNCILSVYEANPCKHIILYYFIKSFRNDAPVHLSTKLMNCRELNCNVAQLLPDIFIVVQIFSSLLLNFFATNKIIRK